MFRKLKPALFVVAASFSCIAVNAQSSDLKKQKEESITIHKKDSTKEKITVVIDGNNITVNGKPVDDFTSNDIDIIKNDMDEDYNVHTYKSYGYGGGTAVAPMPPAPQIRAFSDDMSKQIKSNAAFLGIMTEKTDTGAKVTDVTDGSAAEKAGLKENDIITKIGDDKITGPDDLYKSIGKRKPDDKITITYSRNGKQLTANATLGKSEQVRVYSWNAPGDFSRDFGKEFNRNFSFSWDSKPRLGLSVQDTEEGTGVKVLDIDDEDSPAAKAGLKEDDIITQVNGKAIASTDDLSQSIKDIKKGDTVKITYKRNNQIKTVDVKIPKELKTIDL